MAASDWDEWLTNLDPVDRLGAGEDPPGCDRKQHQTEQTPSSSQRAPSYVAEAAKAHLPK